jgi:hypothetical protein
MEFLKALKEAVDEIASLDRGELTALLKERENNDVSQFIIEMGVLKAGEQEAKEAPAFDVFDQQSIEVKVNDFDFRSINFPLDSLKGNPSLLNINYSVLFESFGWNKGLVYEAPLNLGPSYTVNSTFCPFSNFEADLTNFILPANDLFLNYTFEVSGKDSKPLSEVNVNYSAADNRLANAA